MHWKIVELHREQDSIGSIRPDEVSITDMEAVKTIDSMFTLCMCTDYQLMSFRTEQQIIEG